MRRLLLSLTLALAPAALLVSAPVAGAKPGCVVTNARTGQTYGSLQGAVNAANEGDALTVRGYCVGDTTIEKPLTIEGGTANPTLDGANSESTPGHVLNVLEVPFSDEVKVSGLRITGGWESGSAGGGVHVAGASLTLNDDSIYGNVGGGIAADVFALTGPSGANITVDDSSVDGNTGSSGGGIAVFKSTLILNDSDVSGNAASVLGGGISDIEGVANVIDSQVSRNSSAGNGGGIGAENAELELRGSKVERNSATDKGGGIFGELAGVLIEESSVSRNEPDNVFTE